MTPRENFIHFLKNEPYEWTPCSPDRRGFCPSIIPDHIARAMVCEQAPYTGVKGGKDLFGVEWVYVPSVGGSMETGIMFEDITEWEKYVTFPNLDDLDWEGCAKANAEYLNTDELLHSTIFTGYFERLISFVGFENASLALIDEDEQVYVHKLFDKLTDFYIDMIHRLHKYFNVEMVDVHDDWGNQRSLMFSTDTHREMILPYIKRLVDAAHAEGVFIEQHSCGKVEALLPNMIESGVDTWRGQRNVVDKDALVEKYGDQFKFCVEIRPGENAPDDLIRQAAKEAYAKYHGKEVWVMMSRFAMGENMVQEIYAEIRKMGHI